MRRMMVPFVAAAAVMAAVAGTARAEGEGPGVAVAPLATTVVGGGAPVRVVHEGDRTRVEHGSGFVQGRAPAAMAAVRLSEAAGG